MNHMNKIKMIHNSFDNRRNSLEDVKSYSFIFVFNSMGVKNNCLKFLKYNGLKYVFPNSETKTGAEMLKNR